MVDIIILVQNNCRTYDLLINQIKAQLGEDDRLVVLNNTFRELNLLDVEVFKNREVTETQMLNHLVRNYLKQDHILILDGNCACKNKHFLENIKLSLADDKIGFCRIDTIRDNEIFPDERLGIKDKDLKSEMCQFAGFLFSRKVFKACDGFNENFQSSNSTSHAIYFCALALKLNVARLSLLNNAGLVINRHISKLNKEFSKVYDDLKKYERANVIVKNNQYFKSQSLSSIFYQFTPLALSERYTKEEILSSKYAFIIPFRFEPIRFILLQASIKKLQEMLSLYKVDYCIYLFEDGYTRTVDLTFKKYENLQYVFVEKIKHQIFNRGWCFNYVIKNYVKEERMILMDGDLIFGNLSDILSSRVPSVAWTKLNYMTPYSTKVFLKDNYTILPEYDKSILPAYMSACGGATVISKQVFYDIKGFYEDIVGWGGEDNLFMSKLFKLGYNPRLIPGEIYHLYHAHKTKKFSETSKKTMDIIRDKTTNEWRIYNQNVLWGNL